MEFFYLDRSETPSYLPKVPSYAVRKGLWQRHIVPPTCAQPASHRLLHPSCGIDRLPGLLFSPWLSVPTEAYSPSQDTTTWPVIAWQSHGPQDNGWRQPHGLCLQISPASGPARYERRVDQGKLCPHRTSHRRTASTGRLRALSALPWASHSGQILDMIILGLLPPSAPACRPCAAFLLTVVHHPGPPCLLRTCRVRLAAGKLASPLAN